MLCISRLPRTGLGNKLFVWAHGEVFSRVNRCRHLTLGWIRVPVGIVLRGRSKPRIYVRYFKRQGLRDFIVLCVSMLIRKKITLSPEECSSHMDVGPGTVVQFRTLPHWSEYFINLKDHREYLKESLYGMLRPEILQKLSKYSPPYIGVHVRLGDFRPLEPGEVFSRTGGTRTPQQYFAGVITSLRKFLGENVPVTLFTDGQASQLKELLALPNVRIADDDLDIVHLLLLSKSRIILLSAGSTFGFWSAFLSQAIVINHYDHTHKPIRDPETNSRLYEGIIRSDRFEEWNPLLKKNLLDLKTSEVPSGDIHISPVG